MPLDPAVQAAAAEEPVHGVPSAARRVTGKRHVPDCAHEPTEDLHVIGSGVGALEGFAPEPLPQESVEAEQQRAVLLRAQEGAFCVPFISCVCSPSLRWSTACHSRPSIFHLQYAGRLR